MRWIPLLAFVLSMALPVSAEGQTTPACSMRSDIISHMAKKYDEHPAGLGLANNGGVMELLTTLDGETWTLIITMPSGITCFVASGERWEDVPLTKPTSGRAS